MSASPLSRGLFELKDVNRERRFAQVRLWRAHVSRRVSELVWVFIGHGAKSFTQFVNVKDHLNARLHRYARSKKEAGKVSPAPALWVTRLELPRLSANIDPGHTKCPYGVYRGCLSLLAGFIKRPGCSSKTSVFGTVVGAESRPDYARLRMKGLRGFS